ncbi:hypothetical protein GCM10007972_24800 [Iodidimonas muriae]|uniref:Uncharacterized protein n=1 Tax=Iodidimonas muriae TaxID=261467 RepID=A0ABQ2LFM8_9PROT|nr:hypothetical protein [Iodidimonas muriae]GER08831.1 hypothetical protein JCM17843_31410 [Kordiimonadales bacterium JCM 17843]GGO16119.1 hypothetical protein GCM10007972_24800 [Iodidimonas muriae]
MTIFAAAVDDLFADPNIARDAVWRAGGTGAPVMVRVILRRPDRIGNFGETRLLAATTVIEVRTAEVPALSEGDGFEFNGESFIVQGEPVRDGERLVWTAEVVAL